LYSKSSRLGMMRNYLILDESMWHKGWRCRGTVPGDRREVSPISESLQSLRAKRSISHEHQKTPRLSPISEGSLLASPLLHSYVGAGFSPSPLFRSAFRSAGLRALSGPQENEKGLFRGNGEQFYAAGSACCVEIPCIRGSVPCGGAVLSRPTVYSPSIRFVIK
jgi:hypothetical protein